MANIKDITSGTVAPGDNSIAKGSQPSTKIPKQVIPAQSVVTDQPDYGFDSPSMGVISEYEVKKPEISSDLRTPIGTQADGFNEVFGAYTDHAYSPVEKMIYENALEQDDPEGYVEKWKTAKELGKYYNVPSYEAFSNYDLYIDDYLGAGMGKDYKTAGKAIADSFAAGTKMIELSFAGNAAYFDDAKLDDVKRIAGEIAHLNYDRIPRSWYVDAAKVFGNVIPYSAYLGGSTFLAGIMTGGLGAAPAAAGAAGAAAGAMNVTRGAAALATVIKVADFAHSAIMLNGSAYADMVTKGVDPKAARLMSPVAGVAGTVIERFIGAGLEGAYKRAGVELGAKLTGKEVSEALTKRIAGKFLTAGGLDTVAKNYIKEAASTTIGEAAEEGLQAVTDGVAMMIAESISEELGVPVMDTTEAWDIFRDAASSMVTSLYVAPILGAPANLVTAFTTVERAKQINSLARTTDRETYGKIFNELDEVKGLEQSARDELASMIWEKGQSDLITDQTKAREAAKESVPEGQKAPERTERGDITFSEQIVSEENGKTTVEYTAGPANNPHATVEFDIDGDKLVIVAAEFRDEYRSTADELIQQIASEYPTKEIVLADPDTVDPTIAGAYERAVKMGPTGKASWVSTGDTQQDAEAKQRVRSSLARTGIIGQAQQELTIILMDNMAKGSGKTFSSFAGNLEGFDVNEALKESGKVGSLVTAEDAVKEAKYVIELAKNANFAVVVHELGHFARKTLGDSAMLRDLESVYGISDGVWTTEKEEQFTNDLMKYITDGKVKDEKLRGVFQRIADFLARTWRGVLSKAELSESVEQWFDKYFSGEMSQAEAMPVQTSTVETEIVPPPPGVEIEPFVDANKMVAEVSKEQKTVEDAEVAMGVNEIKEILKPFGDGPLFMSEDEIKRSSATVHEAASQEAADYKTVEEWMEAIGQDYNKLRNDQKKWVNGLFNYAHSDKKVKFKPGEFAKMMDNDKVVEFITDLEKQIYERQKSQMGRERQKAIADAALKTPTIKRLVDKIHSGEALSVQDLTEAKRYIRGNETIVKFLYARLNSDNDLAFEAASSMKDVYPLARKMLLSRPGITMKEQAEIMLDIKDKAIRDKIKGRTIKVSDLDAFIKAIKVPLVTEKDLRGAKLRDYKQKVAERDAARRLRAAIIKRKRYIMQKVPGSVDLEQRKAIELVQQYVQQAGKGPIDLSKLKALASVVFKRNPKMIEVYVNQVKAISEKPFDEWTFAEVDNLSKLVKRLIDEGKAKRAEQRLAFSIARDEIIQRMMDSISNKKGYKAPLTEGTEEWKEQQKKVNKNYDAINIDRFANKLGLDEKLLFDDTVRCMRDKLSRIDERTSYVNQFIQNKDIEIDGKSMKIFDALHRTVEVDGIIGLKGEKATWTRTLLMGAYLLVGSKDKFNQSQREAFVYGNLFSLQENRAMSREQSIELLSERAEKIISVAEATFTDGEKELMEMMLNNLNLYDAWLRFHDAVYEATGREMVHEKWYFPEVFRGGIKSDDNILEAASSTFGEGVLDLGITYTRARNLKPENRRPLEHDAVRLFFDSVRHQEHISAFAGHLKTVKAVFGGVNSQSYGLRQVIEANYGKNATKYLDEFIDALSKTGDFSKKTAGTDSTSLWRGMVVTAVLGFRLSSVLMQLGTSPLPFLQEVNPVELMSSMMSIAASGNPFDAIAASEKKSSILRNRQLDPKKEIERMNDTGFEGWVKRFGTVSMSGIYWGDRLTVTAGWNAVYNKKKREGMSDSEAIMYADKVIIRTQPSSEGIYQAPMYRDMDFFKRMFLQFTRPQNVIYQNFRYDMPRAWSEGNHMKAVMIATAYAMSGLIMGLVWVARGRGPEDDEDLMAYYAWAMTSQFTDAIPIAGEVVSQVTRSAFTGEKFRPFSGQQLPVLESGAEAVGGVLDMFREGWDEDKAYRVADRAAKAGSYFVGVPYIGPKEIVDFGRAIYNATQE